MLVSSTYNNAMLGSGKNENASRSLLVKKHVHSGLVVYLFTRHENLRKKTKECKHYHTARVGNFFGLICHFKGSRRQIVLQLLEETRFPKMGCFNLLYESDTKKPYIWRLRNAVCQINKYRTMGARRR